MFFIVIDETYLKIYDGDLTDPKLCKNIVIPRTAQVSNVLVSVQLVLILTTLTLIVNF